jgi:V/A-type H+-transporting ATPase subunit F
VLTHKIAAMGEADRILGFKALGIETFPVGERDDPAALLEKLMEENEYAIIFVAESLAERVERVLIEHAGAPLPSVVYIPGSRGDQGYAMQRIRRIIERAVGADILSGKEVE